MKIIDSGLSEETQEKLLSWLDEYDNNYEHDINENTEWNALVEYLMDLEKHYRKEAV